MAPLTAKTDPFLKKYLDLASTFVEAQRLRQSLDRVNTAEQYGLLTRPSSSTEWTNPRLNPLRPFSIRQRAVGMPGAPALKGQELIRAAYEQVFGTKLLLDTFRVPVLESKLLNGELSIREFVRTLAKSEYYLQTFYLSCSNNRFVELSFKHLLGRPPYTQRETFDYSSIASRRGFEATIDAFVDSQEYQTTFGEDTLPYARKMHEGPEGQGFDRVGITDLGLLGSLKTIGNPTTSSYVQALFQDQPRPMQVLQPLFKPEQPTPTTASVLGAYMDLAKDVLNSRVYFQWSKGTEALRPLRPFSIRQRTTGMPGAPALKGQELIRAAYEQVFGTKLLLDTFRVPVLESKLLNSELSIREFVRVLAKSEYYFVTFYQGCSNNRFVELSFKHLLGRAPYSKREIFDYSSIASRRGFGALIDALVDSPEYQQTFGEDTLPYLRKMHEGPNVQGFDSIGITDPGLLTALDMIGNPTTSSYVQAKDPDLTLCDYRFTRA
ncbi:phycobilisome rod-core linker polypeptide [Candidatus Cyanaurora vandensis]|uniref:phycobilisome rod-core linker polypeptide n=1 Tax=Candidatus Cyanaurora vandensis TaxID=2714958 RepID=UPI002580C316|nr:phycobilisome rod-core linker polypeptide [Candidatus Cyanaurora vandensis]